MTVQAEKNSKENHHGDFYQSLRAKVKKWAETNEGKENKWLSFILIAPDLFHLMCKLTVEKDVPVEYKAKLAIAIAYFVSPIDLIPELLVGPVGYVDDIAIAVYVLNGLINDTNPEVVKKHWAGEGDILEVIKYIMQTADEMVGKGLWKKLMAVIDKLKK